MKRCCLVLFVLLAIGMSAKADVVAITVPNADFEQVYKPGSTTITADLIGKWTNGVGPDTAMDGDQTTDYSDGTTGTSVDVPGWINTPGWPPSYTWAKGCGSVAGEISTPDGLYYYTVNGGGWGNPQGGTIVSAESLYFYEPAPEGYFYVLSMMAKGNWDAANPVVLDLLAEGVKLTPTSSVNPVLSTDDWQVYSRTYDTLPGGDLRITLGLGSDATGGQTVFDAVTFECIPEPATMLLLGLGGLVLVRRKRR